jgi:Rod binding domain-containing protein
LTAPIDGVGGLPIGPTALPREVRDGTPDQQKAYRAALSFERVLVGQLLHSLGDDALGMGSGDSGEDGDDGSAGPPAAYKELLPNTLADSLTQNGGIGLAQNIYKSIPAEPK